MNAIIIFMFACFIFSTICNPVRELNKHSIITNWVLWIILSFGGGFSFMLYLYNNMIPQLQTKTTMIWLFLFGIILSGCGGVLLRYCIHCVVEQYKDNKEFLHIIRESNRILRKYRKIR